MLKVLTIMFFLVRPAMLYSETMPKCPEDINEIWDNCIGVFEFNNSTVSAEVKNPNLKEWSFQSLRNFSSGSKYEGEWRDNKAEGYGVIYLDNGGKITGQFKNNALNGEATFLSFEGSKYVGNHVDNNRQGYGILTYSSGAIFEGKFYKNDIVKGVIEYKSGDVYKGSFLNEEWHGLGIASLKNSSTTITIFHRNKLHGVAYIFEPNKILLCEYYYGESKGCQEKTSLSLVPDLAIEFKKLEASKREEVQEKLKNFGFYNGSIDGVWGKNTLKSLLAFSAYERDTLNVMGSSNAKKAIEEILN